LLKRIIDDAVQANSCKEKKCFCMRDWH